MKWSYKNCEVQLNTAGETDGTGRLRLVVEIRCKETVPSHLLTTGEYFASERQAVLFGATMAHQWIDEHIWGQERSHA